LNDALRGKALEKHLEPSSFTPPFCLSARIALPKRNNLIFEAEHSTLALLVVAHPSFLFYAGVACGRRNAVIDLLLLEILRLFLIEFGRDKRDLGLRRTSGSITAGAPATTVAPAMSAMSLMLFIILYVDVTFLVR
jgi:hypothetical protein